MDHNYTQQLLEWLNTPDDQRDLAQGALYLLQLSGNRILYNNLLADLSERAPYIAQEIKRYYDYRAAQHTHEEVEAMEAEVSAIMTSYPSVEESDEQWKQGRRYDHDELPEEIQALYTENLSLRNLLRETHLKLRSLTLDHATCPDSERYPFLKELIKIDKKIHANWDTYDHYGQTTAKASGAKIKYTKKSK